MGVGKDEWEKAQEEKELQEFEGSLAEAAEAVRRRVGEREWQRVRLRHTVGTWLCILGLLAVLLTPLCLLQGLRKSLLADRAPSLFSNWEPPLGGGLLLLATGIGVGIALLAAGYLVSWMGDRRLEYAAGRGEETSAALLYLSTVPAVWKRVPRGDEEGRAQPPRVAPQVAEQDEWEDRHWLRVEVSGAHLIWWLSFIATAVYALSPTPSPHGLDAMPKWVPPEWLMNGVFGVAAVGLLLKVLVPCVLLRAWQVSGRNPETRRQLKRYYRFWAKGLPPAALALAPAFVYWGVHSLLSG